MFWKRYLIPLIVTVVLFLLAFYLSSQLAARKIDQVRAIQDKISTDILSTETRFSLLGSSSCKNFKANDEFEDGLNNELSEMARKVKFMESQLGYNDERVLLIKNQYALLQIKDYLLQKQLSERCGEYITTVLYFNNLSCVDCKEQSIVLDEINNKYPSVRIYWLDSDSNTPALKTLISMFDIKSVPTIVIGEKKYEGFQSLEKLSLIFDKTEKAKLKTTSVPKTTTSIPSTKTTTTDTTATDATTTETTKKETTSNTTAPSTTDTPTTETTKPQ